VPADAFLGELTEEGMTYRLNDTTLQADQLLHLGCYPDPRQPCWFRSPIDAAKPAFELTADQDAAHAALVKTGSMGKVAIMHPGAMSDQTVEAIRNAWSTMHATADGASRPLILREGMKAERISQETSSSVLESRRFSVQEIARAYGVPPEMLFQQGGGALASQAETARAYSDGAIALWASAWESELTRKLCRPGERVKFDISPITRGSLRDQGMSYSKLVLAGVMSPNDARHMLGLPPVAGLDTPTVSMPGGSAAEVGNPDAEGDQNA
jgi:HK97 family phage portal protein